MPSLDMFYEYQGIMGHKALLMEKLLMKVREALESCQVVEIEIMDDLK